MCVCIIKLHSHFLPDLAQILNKAMNSKGAASKPVPGADFIQLLILRHLFVSHTQILADSQSDCEKVVEPKRNPNRSDFFGIQLSIQLGTKTGASVLYRRLRRLNYIMEVSSETNPVFGITRA